MSCPQPKSFLGSLIGEYVAPSSPGESLWSWKSGPEDAPAKPEGDPVNKPAHYTAHPSGVECITITEHLSFCVGNAIKYLWRADLKGNALEDLKKARYYVDREIKRRGGE